MWVRRVSVEVRKRPEMVTVLRWSVVIASTSSSVIKIAIDNTNHCPQSTVATVEPLITTSIVRHSIIPRRMQTAIPNWIDVELIPDRWIGDASLTFRWNVIPHRMAMLNQFSMVASRWRHIRQTGDHMYQHSAIAIPNWINSRRYFIRKTRALAPIPVTVRQSMVASRGRSPGWIPMEIQIVIIRDVNFRILMMRGLRIRLAVLAHHPPFSVWEEIAISSMKEHKLVS